MSDGSRIPRGGRLQRSEGLRTELRTLDRLHRDLELPGGRAIAGWLTSDPDSSVARASREQLLSSHDAKLQRPRVEKAPVTVKRTPGVEFGATNLPIGGSSVHTSRTFFT